MTFKFKVANFSRNLSTGESSSSLLNCRTDQSMPLRKSEFNHSPLDITEKMASEIPVNFENSGRSNQITPFHWLHIRKAGGTSLMKILSPYYEESNKVHPTPFIALPRSAWMDNLNNWRVPLGEYEFRRMLFAKKFLYSEAEFLSLYKFAIVRNPYHRAVSSWKYCTKLWKYGKPRHMKAHRSFSYFLSMIPELWEERWDRHAFTHTAPMWRDITDENGCVLLDDIFKLEQLQNDIGRICDRLGLPKCDLPRLNISGDSNYARHFNRKILALIESLYQDDIEQFKYHP